MSDKWALVLGASSGFGAAIAKAFAQSGYGIVGIHLDRRHRMAEVEGLIAELKGYGVPVHFFNRNAASDDVREDTVKELHDIVGSGGLKVLVHSLAFGSLRPYIPDDGGRPASRKQLEMTVDVMANSLVYWTQSVVQSELMGAGGRIFAMTSSGSHTAWSSYGPVSAAKAAMESHVRQLCLELAPHNITVNALLAGVTETPALSKIPGADRLKGKALAKNPHGRLTRPEDIAQCMVELARTGTYWMTGNVIRVDGGEDFCA